MRNIVNWELIVVYYLLGETGWPTDEVDGTCQTTNGNLHGIAVVPFPRLFPGR